VEKLQLMDGRSVPGDRNGPVGVVIRTLNESEFIGRCLETLQRQRGAFELDLLVVDSGSTDATLEIVRSHGARIVNLPAHDFDYSKALNVGIAEVRGELVVSLSAHAIPLDDGWLETITAPFADARVAGVSSRQVPWPGAPWQEVHRLRHQFGDAASVYSRESGDGGVIFSNAASVIRRSVWTEHRFTLPAAEDLDWAQRVVTAGWAIVYEPRTAVYHSHHEGPRAQALRMMDINRVLDRDEQKRTLRRGVREAAGMFLRDSRKILALDEPLRRKAAYLLDLLRMVSYYVLDFSRSGTTAERRREDSRRISGGASET
jgi:glycosyltransferase involved in cell wall biosynthesis